MTTCKVYGYIVTGQDEPVEGNLIQFIPASLPTVNAVTGKAICSIPVECITTSSGYFEADLMINTDFMAIIPAMGIKAILRVPEETEKKLFELIGTYESGDPSPVDPGNTEPNW